MSKLILILFISLFSSASYALDSLYPTAAISDACSLSYDTATASSTTPGWLYLKTHTQASANSYIAQGWGSQSICGISNGDYDYSMRRTYTSNCPADSTLISGSCVCTAPKVESADHKSCVAPCPAAGSAVGTQGYISVGTSPYSLPPKACDSGCPSQFVCTDCSKFSRLVNGVKEYYVYGGYSAKAGTCTEGDGNPYAAPELDADGCSSTQSKITMGGKTKCIDSDGKNTNPNSASAVADTKTLDDAARAAAINAASAAAAAAGLSASGVAAAAAGAAANYGGGGGASGKGKDPVMSAYCSQNPTDKMCTDDEFGEVEDSEITNQDKPVAITPVSVGSAGSCPAPSTLVISGETHYFSWDTYCEFASGIKPIMLVFAWLSAAGILIGGFRE